MGGKRKIVISYYTNKLFAEDFFFTHKSQVTTLRGNVALIHLQTVRRSFLTSAFVIKLSWGTERQARKTRREITKGPELASEATARGGEWGWKLSKSWRGRKEKEKKEEVYPDPNSRDEKTWLVNLQNGTKKVPVRGQTLVLSLCIFDTYSVTVHDVRSFFVFFICDREHSWHGV